MDSIDATGAPYRPPTLVHLLRNLAERKPDDLAFTFLVDGEQQEEHITFGELDRRARAVAAWLQQAEPAASNPPALDSGQHGRRALLLFPPGLDFIAAFLGCLYAGVVAIPSFPPRLNRPSMRVQAIVANAQASLALTTGQVLEGLEKRFNHTPDLATLQWLDLETIGNDLAAEWREPRVTADNLAFLQYTSGSTGQPKGVMVSHANLLHNLEVIRQGFRINGGSGASWLPSYHDMGLIGGMLEPMYLGLSSVLMAPTAFLQRPARWLEMISRYQATISGAPNFAYQMCVDKISPEQREQLDLSSWEIAFCGAEPIRPETLEAFATMFAPHGFRREAFYPCYGLAESTLMVTGGDGPAAPAVVEFQADALAGGQALTAAVGDKDAVALVSCGHARLGQHIAIVEPETLTVCEEGEIGEIWVGGPSVTQGYWQQTEETDATFQAYLAGCSQGPYLRTGDLGFLYDGALYITGRLKDLIIIRGRNYYPHDIEHTVSESHEALEPDMGAAFSVTVNGEEKLVLVHELSRKLRKTTIEDILPAVRRAVAREHELQIHALVLIRPLSLPRTSSGKIRRRACHQAFLEGSLSIIDEWRAPQESQDKAQRTQTQVAKQLAGDQRQNEISAWLTQRLSTWLGTSAEQIDVQRPLVDFGLDSVQAVELSGELGAWLGRSLPPTLAWDYPTIAALAVYLAQDNAQPVEERGPLGSATRPASANEAVAVIGIGCRFPDADGPDDFWQLLYNGRDAIRETPADRWPVDALFDSSSDPAKGKMSTRWGGFLNDVDRFDAAFFGISPREASRMDPQQRLLLEVTWQALEHAGIDPTALAGSATGVFVGISSSDYSRLQFDHLDLIDAYAGTGNAHSIAANRLSYVLDLRGPSMAVDTACSSSLVATHMALQSLRAGESDLALAGGVNLILSPELTITFSQARMMAADGRCKTFDASADGYVRGEGCGMLVLKRLADAQRDGDPILAVLRGSAVNQDGRSNGLTAPNGLAQQAVIRSALADAGVRAADIQAIEAHGTGTRLGDPIEIHALQAVFDDNQADRPLLVGSVKTNVGHLEAAAGVAGLIKSILALVHETIPPHLHLQTVNPHITLEGSRLVIDGRSHAWPRAEMPRLIGVSSFGFGGTNAHVILQEAPLAVMNPATTREDTGPHLLLLSAKDGRALRELALRYAEYLAAHPSISLADVCYSTAVGRARFEQRLAAVASTVAEMREALLQEAENLSSAEQRAPQLASSSTAFLFTGQGAQYAGMGRQLYAREPAFRAALNRCAAILDQSVHWDVPLLDLLFAADGDEQRIDQTAYTQPALFAIEFALAELWRSWGIEPDVVIGHSVGDYVAACVAGILSLEDGLKLVAARGWLMSRLHGGHGAGSMAAVFAPETRVQSAIDPYREQVAIAAINGPAHVIISGQSAAVATLLQVFQDQGIETRPLIVSHAFHSPLMDPLLDEFAAVAEQCEFRAPRIPFVSNLTGQLLTEAPDAQYWREHIRRPVRFADGLTAVIHHGAKVLLEIGPQPHLTGMARRIFADDDTMQRSMTIMPSLRRGQDERRTMLESLGRLFVAGKTINTAGVFAGAQQARNGGPRRLHLPTYPFQRERFWIEDASGAPFGKQVSQIVPNQPQRLPTAVPLFETWLALSGGPADADVLRENVMAVARLFWGSDAHELQTFQEFDTGQGLVRTQMTLTLIDADIVSFQLFAHDEGHNRWRMLAGGQSRLRQGVETKTQLVRTIAAESPAQEDTRASSVLTRDTLLAAEPSLRADLLLAYLQDAVTAVLGLEPGERQRVHPDRSLDALGLDSLMALELKNRVERELGLDFPLAALLQGPQLGDLATKMADADYLVAAPPSLTIEPQVAAGQAAPLSYGQQAMWLLHQVLPPDLSLNVAGVARIIGGLDVPALERALKQLVARHGALRTVFTVGRSPGTEAQALQTVLATMSVPLTRIDAVAWDEESVDAFLQREAYRPFDLEQGPLLRLVLVKQSAQEHLLLLAINHLTTDFWSMSLLVRDLYLLYQIETDGSRRQPANGEAQAELELPPPSPIQVADFARWQLALLDSAEGQAHRQYWLAKLAGELPRLDLPTDRPRSPLQTFAGDSTRRTFSPALTDQLHALSRQQGTTLATTLLAAFQTLLYRYTGQEDLLVGSVIAGREHPALQDLIGYLINPVALRADFHGRPSFNAFLAQVRQTMLEAIAHQDYPLARLAADLVAAGQLTLDPGRPPLFETMFIMQRAQLMEEQGLSAFALGVPGARLQMDDLIVESHDLGGLPAQFDLTLMMAEVDGGLTAALHYNTHLFEAATAARLLQHLEMLLHGIATDPDRAVDEIPLLSPAERDQQLVSWNRTTADYPREKTLHQLIAEQARRTPQKTAVTFGHQSWTYAELEQRAEQLAIYLRQEGIGPQKLVGLYVERSLHMVAALLAVLKAGGAYVPIDPDFPAERINLMLQDARPELVITQKHLAARIAGAGVSLFYLDEEWVRALRPKNGSANGKPMAASPQDLAYVIYTSGSTGRPKGVQITHRAAVNFLSSMQREPGLSSTDRLLAVTTLSFDIALLELCLPLSCGAEVVIATREAAMDGRQLQQLLVEYDVTVMQATPVTWRLLLESGWQGMPDLVVLCGGEALTPDLVEQLLPRCRQLWNLYGPTETTVWSTVARVDSAVEPISIGRPIANTQIYLLDDRLQPVPTGAVGQLYIGGDGAARGYLNRPELTAERFLPDPFAGNERRMYKTGDLARYLPDGRLLHLGRDDLQVKVRGYRIELGEIETAVARHPAVARNVTVAREPHPGETQLVTYWVAEEGVAPPSPAELRDFLRMFLPDYMLPSQFVSLETLPLTPNGKIDRRALPAPVQTRASVEAAYVAPRTELEKEVATLCAEVLSLEQLGVFDNFFELGGNSLLAARLVFQAREQFQVQIPLRYLFMQPTVAGLSQAIAAARTNGHETGMILPNGLLAQEEPGPLFGAMSLAELQAEAEEAIAASSIRTVAFAEPLPTALRNPQTILLTGATGFLGAFLLRDLLHKTEATIHCLVRADDAASGLERIRRNLATYELWDDAFAARIVSLSGDLARPFLGLSEDRFTALADIVDAVYHNGALVNFVYSYREHKAPNVLSTQEILRLLTLAQTRRGRPPAVHFISTLSIFHGGQHDDGAVFREDADLDSSGVPFGGYAQSKWVAEKLLMAARTCGAPVVIYRPGLIGGDGVRGIWNTADMISTMVLACAAAGTAPQLQAAVDIVPVDYVSRAIINLAARPESLGQVFHLANPQPVPYGRLLELAKAAGLPLQVVPFTRWRSQLVSLARQLGDESWQSFLPLLEEVTVDQIFMPAFDCQNTLNGLAAAAAENDEAPLHCPPLNADLLLTYLDFFRRSNLLLGTRLAE